MLLRRLAEAPSRGNPGRPSARIPHLSRRTTRCSRWEISFVTRPHDDATERLAFDVDTIRNYFPALSSIGDDAAGTREFWDNRKPLHANEIHASRRGISRSTIRIVRVSFCRPGNRQGVFGRLYRAPGMKDSVATNGCGGVRGPTVSTGRRASSVVSPMTNGAQLGSAWPYRAHLAEGGRHVTTGGYRSSP